MKFTRNQRRKGQPFISIALDNQAAQIFFFFWFAFLLLFFSFIELFKQIEPMNHSKRLVLAQERAREKKKKHKQPPLAIIKKHKLNTFEEKRNKMIAMYSMCEMIR